jgi:hypothetical protein
MDMLRSYGRAGLMPRLRRPPNGHLRCRDTDAAGRELVACLWETGPPIRHVHRYAVQTSPGDEVIAERAVLRCAGIPGVTSGVSAQ